MKRSGGATVAYIVFVAALVIRLGLVAYDWGSRVVAGPVSKTQRVEVELLPPGSSLAIDPEAQASELAWSPDSRLLAVPTYGDVVKLYDGQTGELIRAMGEEASGGPDVAWSFDGGMLASSSYEGNAENPAGGQRVTRIWLAEGTRRADIPGSLLAWANRSNRILIAPYDSGEHSDLWQLWEVTADGQTLLQAEFETERWRVAVSPDDRWVASVSGLSAPDTKLVVWEFDSRRVVAELVGADMDYVDSLAWSPDGAWLAAVYYLSLIHIFEALPETEFAQLRRWMADRDWERWDEQLEADVALGKLDFLLDDVSEAIQLGTV